jgi:hypothetical protein
MASLDHLKFLNARIKILLDEAKMVARELTRDGELRQQSNADYSGLEQYMNYTQQNVAMPRVFYATEEGWEAIQRLFDEDENERGMSR